MTEGVSAFTSMLIPVPLDGGDGEFTVDVNGVMAPVQAGRV